MMEMMAKTADMVGIIGVVLLLVAYYLLNLNKVSAFSLSYQILNLIGAAFILFSLMFQWNTSAVLIEIAWIFISLMGIWRAVKKRQGGVVIDNVYVLNNR